MDIMLNRARTHVEEIRGRVEFQLNPQSSEITGTCARIIGKKYDRQLVECSQPNCIRNEHKTDIKKLSSSRLDGAIFHFSLPSV
jgi:hypothetical protein